MTRRFAYEKGGAKPEVDEDVNRSGATLNGISVCEDGGSGAELFGVEAVGGGA